MILSLEEFLINLDSELANARIELKDSWFIDHICFRAATEKEYKELCELYSSQGELLIEAPVGGRLISTFKLNKPLLFKGQEIPLIEIPMPKIGRKTQSGYEHIEIVIGESFNELMQELSHLQFLTHAITKEINPEVEIEMTNCSVKFHHQSLEDVIAFEKKIGVL